MDKITRVVVSLSCLVAAACGDDDGGDGDGDGGDERRLVLFHTNDEHSHLFGFAPEFDDFPLPTEPGDGAIVGNIARRAEMLAQQRAALEEDEIDSLTVSAGDQTQGALPQIGFASTSPDFDLMAQLGYDIMCPGNHEFDLGPAAYAAAIEAVGPDMPPIVSTNIHFSAEPEDDDLEALYGDGGSDSPIAPYQVIETAGGIRVGFIGIMGVSAAFFVPTKTPVQFSGDLEDEGDRDAILPAIYDDIQPAVDALRNDEEVDVVVALSHSGVDLGVPEQGDDYNIAQNVEGIDIIVSGHTHTPLEEPIVVEGPDGHEVPIVQAGSYGRFLGRVELILTEGERPALEDDPERTLLIPIDDTIVPTDQGILDQLDALIADLEANELPAQLSFIEGAPVEDDPEELGDLYYRVMGETEFDVIGQRSKVETNMLNLSTDAMLAAAEEFAGPTAIAVDASGTVRDDIVRGETGVMSYADLYRVFPLGLNPLDGSIGYPLSRFYIALYEIRGAFEVGASQGYIDDSLYLSASGVRVEYDTDRAPIAGAADVLDPTKGRTTKIILDVNGDDVFDEGAGDVAIFDASRGADAFNSELGNLGTLYPVVTSLYIASFAASQMVVLKDENGDALDLFETILRRPDDTDVKAYEAFIGYILAISAENGGTLPSRYDEKSPDGAIPRHMICSGALCL
jgi:5'-nucleotidase / UDP-sugar diphosphatase